PPKEVGKDTLPFKDKYAKMMGGEEVSTTLPAKFDPAHYQVEMHGQRIIVTDRESRQAIELYRGTPDAAILERLIEERRRRERRNLILGLLGGGVALIVLVVLAAAIFSGGDKKRGTVRPRLNEKAYYEQLNRAVKAYDDGEDMSKVYAFIAKAEKLVGKRTYPTKHIQLKEIFRYRSELAGNPEEGLKWGQILDDVEKIKDEEFPDNVDAGRVKDFIKRVEEEARAEKLYWTRLEEARNNLGRYKPGEEENALRRLREIDAASMYYNEAQQMITKLAVDIANGLLRQIKEGMTLDNLKDVKEEDLEMRTVDVWIDIVDKMLKNTYFRNGEDKEALKDLKFMCETFRNTEQNKDEAVRLAREHLEKDEIVEAWNKVKYLENDTTDEARHLFVQGVKKDYERYLAELEARQKVQEAIDEVIKAYNTGKAEEALELIKKYKDEGLASDEWLTLQNKISRVIEVYKDAVAAEKINDVLLAKQKYENIIELEDSEANHYRQKAEAFLGEYDQTPPETYARKYIEKAKEMIRAGNYTGALDFADKADSLVNADPEEPKKPGNEIRIEINRLGNRMFMDAVHLHDGGGRGNVQKAIEILNEILDKHIYADDSEGNSTANACRSKREEWRRELRER
ncbi:MAG: hypothetical protein DRP79_10115, partial [Planctomycetota bacterium]